MGCTASGKSSVALEVAQALGDVEIVAVDAMTVYRHMDIGTGKPTDDDRSAVPHHLLDLADPSEDFSVTRFQEAAVAAITAIEDRGHRALLVGGTGLYLRAVVDSLVVPPQFPQVRAELEAEGATSALHDRLVALDPVAAARIEPSNRRRVLRALEVTLGAGRPFSSFGPGLREHAPTRFRLRGLWLPRPLIAERIAARYGEQMAAGFVDEVRALSRGSARLSRTAQQALGYRELLAHVAGEVSLDEAIEQAARRTRSFARRQRVWFRRDPRIAWVGVGASPLAAVPALLGDWSRP